MNRDYQLLDNSILFFFLSNMMVLGVAIISNYKEHIS